MLKLLKLYMCSNNGIEQTIIKSSEMLSVNIMLENQQVQPKVQYEENYKALKTVSDLSSENSTRRSELQQKSDTIVSQNKKLKDQHLIWNLEFQ